tara:strand:+ start:1054 stop:1569 length:516 start_codon:yes stop_codon:yes gene_type:complete
MKKKFFILFLLFSCIVFADNKNRKELINFKSLEKASKEIHVVFHQEKNSSFFSLKGYIIKSADHQSCLWETVLSLNEMIDLLDDLRLAVGVDEIKNDIVWKQSNYQIKKNKKGNLNISFTESKCIREHKIYYFQKNCNRKFSFVISKESTYLMLDKVNHHIENINKDLVFR